MNTPDDQLVWSHILDDYERVLDEQARMLDEDPAAFGDASVATFRPPMVSVPLPETLRVRAEALVERTDELAGQAAERLRAHQPRAATTRLRPTRSASASATFDRHA